MVQKGNILPMTTDFDVFYLVQCLLILKILDWKTNSEVGLLELQHGEM